MPTLDLIDVTFNVTETSPEDVKKEALRKLAADAKDYHTWKSIEEDAKVRAAALAPGILAALTRYGSVPDSAPKSRRIETAENICTVTTGTSTEIDDDAVYVLEQVLGSSSKLRAMFKLLFRRRVEYTLEPTARETLLHGKWPRAIKTRVQELYLQCISAKTSTPRLTIESKTEIVERQRKAAEEAEAKAVAAAGKKSRGGKARA